MSIINYGTWDSDSHRIFDDFIKELGVFRRRSSDRVNAWAPPIDVHESDNEFLVKADLPVCILILNNFLFILYFKYTEVN